MKDKEKIASLLLWYETQRYADNVYTGFNKKDKLNYLKFMELVDKFIDKLN